MERAVWCLTQLRTCHGLVRYLMVACVVALIGIGTFRCLVPLCSGNLFVPVIFMIGALLLIAGRRSWGLISFYAGAVAAGVLLNLGWTGCQMGDWRWPVGAISVLFLFIGLARRGWRSISEMRIGAAIVWIATAVAVWLMLRPLFRI